MAAPGDVFGRNYGGIPFMQSRGVAYFVHPNIRVEGVEGREPFNVRKCLLASRTEFFLQGKDCPYACNSIS